MEHSNHFVTTVRMEERATTALRSSKHILRVLLSPCGTPRPSFEGFNVLASLTLSRQRPVIYATAARPQSSMRLTARSKITASKKATLSSHLHLKVTCSPVTHQPQPSAMAARGRCARQRALWHLSTTAISLLVSTKKTASQR